MSRFDTDKARLSEKLEALAPSMDALESFPPPSPALTGTRCHSALI